MPFSWISRIIISTQKYEQSDWLMRSAYFSYFSKEDVKYWNQSIASLERRGRSLSWKKRIIYSSTKNITTKNINMNNKKKTPKEILRFLQTFMSSEFETNYALFFPSFFNFRMLWTRSMTFRIILFESIFLRQQMNFVLKKRYHVVAIFWNLFKEIYWKIPNIYWNYNDQHTFYETYSLAWCRVSWIEFIFFYKITITWKN